MTILPKGRYRWRAGWVSGCLLCAAILLLVRMVDRRHQARQFDLRVARMQIHAVKDAVSAYRQEYGVFQGGIESTSTVPGLDLTELIAVLMCNTNVDQVTQGNPSQIKFLALPEMWLREGVLVDPWNTPYRMGVQIGRDTAIGGNIITDEFAMWSCGPDGVDEFGGGDDVCSWRDDARQELRSQ